MHLFDEPKIDCHPHVLDPQRFPYAANVSYRPAGQEIAPATQFDAVMQAYGSGTRSWCSRIQVTSATIPACWTQSRAARDG